MPGARGPVMLGQVATLEMTGGPAVIDRYDRSRNVNFEIELSGLPLGDVAAAVQQLPAVQEPAAGRQGGGGRRRRGDGRAVRQLRPGHAHRRAVHLHRAGAAVQGLPAPGHHPGRAAAVAGRRLRRPADRAEELLHALADRPDHADGHRHQELDPAGGIRHRGAARPWPEPLRRAAGRLPQAGPAHHHDHHRDGRGHAADRDRLRHGRSRASARRCRSR